MIIDVIRALVVCSILALAVTASKRPSYLLPCSMSHNFSSCAIEHAKYAIPFIVKGDRKLGIQPMNPLRITSADLQGIGNFRLSATNISVYGLDKVEVLNVDADFEKMTAHTLSTVPRLEILGDYQMTGRLMLFPINGHGPMNITILNGLYQYNFNWELEDRNGEKYAKLVNSSYDYKVPQMYYDFKNLINGNDRLSEAVNQVLNDNWKIVDEDLKESALQTLLLIHNDIFRKLYMKIPFRELFLD